MLSFYCHRTFKRRRSGGNLTWQGTCVIRSVCGWRGFPFFLFSHLGLSIFSFMRSASIPKDFSHAVLVEWSWNFLSMEYSFYYISGMCLLPLI